MSKEEEKPAVENHPSFFFYYLIYLTPLDNLAKSTVHSSMSQSRSGLNIIVDSPLAWIF